MKHELYKISKERKSKKRNGRKKEINTNYVRKNKRTVKRVMTELGFQEIPDVTSTGKLPSIM
jgi:hypothetical protein